MPLLFLALLLGLGAAEGVTRVWIWNSSPAVFARYASFRDMAAVGEDSSLVGHHYLAYLPRPNFERGDNRHDPNGFRGPVVEKEKGENEIRVMCLGGSTTYGMGVPMADAYPNKMERLFGFSEDPRVRIINAGANGWTSWESLINLEVRVLEFEPDWIVVYHAINDLKARMVPPGSYAADNRGVRGTPDSIFMPPAWQHSALARVVSTRMGWMEPHLDIETALTRPGSETLWGDLRRALLGSKPYPPKLDEYLETNDPRYFRRNLQNIEAVAARHGVGVVFMTQAFDATRLRAKPTPAHERFDAFMQEMNEVTREVARETGAKLFEFTSVPSRLHFDDEVHLNAEGCMVLARTLGSFLVREGVLPAP